MYRILLGRDWQIVFSDTSPAGAIALIESKAPANTFGNQASREFI
jgi:hypothetical protein